MQTLNSTWDAGDVGTAPRGGTLGKALTRAACCRQPCACNSSRQLLLICRLSLLPLLCCLSLLLLRLLLKLLLLLLVLLLLLL